MTDKQDMSKNGWLIMDGRAVYDTDVAAVLDVIDRPEKPSRRRLRREWGGMSACLCRITDALVVEFVEVIQ